MTTEKQIEIHFQKSCEMRDAYWNNLGKPDPDVISHLINPAFMGGPAWPSLRQAFKTVRRASSTIVASDGLSAPFDEPENEEEASYNGFGLEFYAESPGNIESVKDSWQFDLVYQISQFAAQNANIQPMLREMKVLTSELYDVRVPDEWKNAEDRVGIILGITSKSIPESVQLSLETIDIVNVKLLTIKELEYVIQNGAEGRSKLAELIMNEENPTYSSLDRKSVV